METKLTAEQEARLNQWAAELTDFKWRPPETWARTELVKDIKHLTGAWHKVSEDRMTAWTFDGELAFTRSRDAAHEVLLAMKKLDAKTVYKFGSCVCDLGNAGTACPPNWNDDLRNMNQPVEAVAIFLGFMFAMSAEPVEIILAAYKATTGKDFQ